jgi:Putative esterase
MHLANIGSAAVELADGMKTVRGAAVARSQGHRRQPAENVDKYQNERIFMVAGTSPDPVDWFDKANETEVLARQREFRVRIGKAGIDTSRWGSLAATSSGGRC